MRASILSWAAQALVLGLLASPTIAQSSTAPLGPITTLGCYKKVEPQLLKDNTDTFQTSGLCQPKCANAGHPVMATTGGTTCYCGDELPALDQIVDNSKCNSPCGGFGPQSCGGIGYWTVYLDGLTGDVNTADNTTASTTSAGPSGASQPAQSAATVVVTASSSAAPSKDSDSGPNKVGIAVGVVVGVIVIAAVAGGAIFYLKQKRRREIEEEHKAQAAVNSFVGSRSSDTKSDARLDPSVASSYRRESIGSIADERDFSRKILQVRNPDHNRGSMNSLA